MSPPVERTHVSQERRDANSSPCLEGQGPPWRIKVNSEHADQNQPESSSVGDVEQQPPFDTEDFVAPGIPIVRSSTPKPLSFGLFESNGSPSQVSQQSEQNTLSIFPV